MKNPQFGKRYDVDDYQPPYGDFERHLFNSKKTEEEREKEVNSMFSVTTYKGKEVCDLYNHNCKECAFHDDSGCTNLAVLNSFEE